MYRFVSDIANLISLLHVTVQFTLSSWNFPENPDRIGKIESFIEIF